MINSSRKNVLTHLNERNQANNGMWMTIIRYKSYFDIDIQFDDGIIVKNAQYAYFKSGCIKHPNIDTRTVQAREKHLNERNQSNSGIGMTIIAYRSNTDIDIMFDDGIIVKNKLYHSFKIGCIEHPNISRNTISAMKKNLHRTNIAKNGMRIEIIDYRSYRDIDVQFEDGVVVEHTSCARFNTGKLAHPSINTINAQTKEQYLNKRTKNKLGIWMECITYTSSKDIDIKFESGMIIRHTNTYSFNHKEIKHPLPYQIKNVIMDKFAYKDLNDVGNFYCYCTKCNHRDIWDISEIQSHKC